MKIREYSQGKVTDKTFLDQIHHAYRKVSNGRAFTVLEGSGHTGVGAIMRLTNARIASELGVEVVLVGNGSQRLSWTVDELALNR